MEQSVTVKKVNEVTMGFLDCLVRQENQDFKDHKECQETQALKEMLVTACQEEMECLDFEVCPVFLEKEVTQEK